MLFSHSIQHTMLVKKNLVFSLPNDLVSFVYEYDPTYRHIFKTKLFLFELQTAFLNSNRVRQRCIEQVLYYFNQLIDRGRWWNEFGYIRSSNPGFYYNLKIKCLPFLNANLPKYKSVNEFVVVLHQVGIVLYYKILPKSATKENCSFLVDPRYFDGYFVHNSNKNNLCIAFNAAQKCTTNGVVKLSSNTNTSLSMFF